MISCSATQRSSWSARRLERARRPARGSARRTAAAPARRARARRTRTGRARGRPRKPETRRPRPPARRRPAPPSGPASARSSFSAAGSSTVAQRRQVRLDPARAVDRPRPRAPAARRLEARCRRRRAARPPPRAPRAARTGPGRRRAAGWRPRAPPVPARFQSITRSSVAGSATRQRGTGGHAPRARRGVRAAITGECGIEVQRRGERVVVGDERDVRRPPRARSAARRRRRPRGSRFSVAIPSKRAAATWHSETAIEPIARMRCAVAVERVGRTATTQRGSADSTPTTSSLPSRSRRSADARVERRAVELAPSPRRATHSSPGPKSCTKPNTTSAIVGAVGDRDRERVVRQPALGVQRAVDRVDDDEHGPGRRSRRRRAPR